MILRLTRLLSTIIMLVLNTLAMSLPLNGLSTKDLSDILSTLITPAWFTFSIWSLIYLGIIGLTVGVLTKKIHLPDRAMIWYAISALANGLWIVAWHYQNLYFAMILILVLLISLIFVDRSIIANRKSIAYFSRVRGSILLYFWWVQIATLLMTTIYLQYQLGWIRWYETSAGMAVLILAWCINILIICREKTIITSLVGIRALWGIINGQTDPQIILTAQVMIGVLIAGIAWNEGKILLKR